MMIRRSPAPTAPKDVNDMKAVTKTRFGGLKVPACFGFALLAGWAWGAGPSGCADPVIVDQNFDFGNMTKGDGGTVTTSVKYSASPSTKGALLSEVSVSDYQQWKRDPAYVVDGTDLYMFYAGSSYASEQWSIAYFKSQTAGSWPTTATLAFRGRTGKWDALDLTGPSVRIGGGSAKYTLWYAGNGDPSRPDYVSQIGMATSNDGVNWTRSDAPSLAAPTFNGTSATSTPSTSRPDAYGATDPWVMQDGSSLVMYYAGLDCSSGTCMSQILRSVSSDNGATFPPGSVVLSGRQGIPEEAGGVAGPSVIQLNGQYILTYTEVGTPATKSRLGVRKALTSGSVGVAVSKDGINFSYAGVNPSGLILRASGTSYSEGGGAPSLYASGTALKLYFTGLVDSVGTGTFFSILPADIAEVK